MEMKWDGQELTGENWPLVLKLSEDETEFVRQYVVSRFFRGKTVAQSKKIAAEKAAKFKQKSNTQRIDNKVNMYWKEPTVQKGIEVFRVLEVEQQRDGIQAIFETAVHNRLTFDPLEWFHPDGTIRPGVDPEELPAFVVDGMERKVNSKGDESIKYIFPNRDTTIKLVGELLGLTGKGENVIINNNVSASAESTAGASVDDMRRVMREYQERVKKTEEGD